jgi:protein TonB
MFEDSLMESSNSVKTSSKYWSLLTFAINCAVVVGLAIWPLLHPQALPKQLIAALLVAPVPPPPPVAVQSKPQVRAVTIETDFQAPSRIDSTILLLNEDVAVQPMMISSVDGSVGSPGNGLPGVLEGIERGRTRVAVAAPPQTMNISSGVMAGNLLEKVSPQYPAIARTARVQGTVVLQATISKDGTIQNLRVVSGPPLLRQAALDAVLSWRYRPYLLNGEPVAVETTVNVVFNLGG